MSWHAYILECADGSLYTGSTNDLEKRIHAHNHLPTGAKYTRARRPVVMKYSLPCIDRSEALREEARLKSLTRTQKLSLITIKAL